MKFVNDTTIDKAQGSRWAFMQRYMIPQPDGSPYVLRLRIVQTPLFGLYLHRWFSADNDRDLHDHPWWFVTWIIRGSYLEHINTISNELDQQSRGILSRWQEERKRWSLHAVRLNQCHRVVSFQPGTVTLILTGRRKRSWGFYTSEGYVPFYKYERLGPNA